MNAGLFERQFLVPGEAIRQNVGVLIFEFSQFFPNDYEHGRDFVADLDKFLGALPKGWPYAIEMRNKTWLKSEYFDCLSRHGVTHVFNSWNAMPPVDEQMALPGSGTNPDLIAARFLLKPGRSYEEAVKIFQPYDRAKEANPMARNMRSHRTFAVYLLGLNISVVFQARYFVNKGLSNYLVQNVTCGFQISLI